MELRKRNILVSIVLASVLTVFAVLAVFAVRSAREYRYLTSTYDSIIELIEKGRYEDALTSIQEVREINSSYYYNSGLSRLSSLCYGHKNYDAGNYETAYNEVSNLTLSLENEIIQNDLENLKRDVGNAYYEEKKQADYELRKKQEESGVPYVGMDESKIATTTLGAPSSTVSHGSYYKDGKVYETNQYTFTSNGHRIFTATCVEGKVIEVKDYRSTANTGSSSGSSSGSDPLHASQYENPEEFYYDNYLDFDSFTDAEVYWEDNH